MVQDLPEESFVGVTIRVAYSVGLILTFPLQLFPAVRVRIRKLANNSIPKQKNIAISGARWPINGVLLSYVPTLICPSNNVLINE